MNQRSYDLEERLVASSSQVIGGVEALLEQKRLVIFLANSMRPRARSLVWRSTNFGVKR